MTNEELQQELAGTLQREIEWKKAFYQLLDAFNGMKDAYTRMEQVCKTYEQMVKSFVKE